MTADGVVAGLLFGALVTFGAGFFLGLISKRTAYLLGVVGSALSTILSLTILVSGGTTSIDLWKVTSSSFAQLQVSQFNSYFLLISSLVWLGTRRR